MDDAFVCFFDFFGGSRDWFRGFAEEAEDVIADFVKDGRFDFFFFVDAFEFLIYGILVDAVF